MQLRSSAFPDGTTIPRRFTCDGTDLSPPLDWSDAPETTRSFVLLCDDPDAPAGTWRHWAAYDIPADRAALMEGAAQQGKGFKQAINDFQQPGYGGPCPPRGDGIHRYRFRLLALAVDRLPARREPSCQAVEREASKHLLAEATLIGTYQR
jgi:Raf kinase inhibitor-like YbhB/YbcL family protein